MLKIAGLFTLVLMLLVLVVTATGQLHLLHESSILGLVLIWTLYLVFLLGKKHLFGAINSLLLFVLFATAEMLHFEHTEPRTLLTYSLLSIGLSLAIIVVNEQIKPGALRAVPYLLLAAIYLVPLGFIVYYLQFEARLSADAIGAVMQTNVREALDFLIEFVSMGWVLLVMSIIVAMSYLLYRQERTEAEEITPSLAIFLVVTFLTAAHANRSDFQLYRFTKDHVKNYSADLARFKAALTRRKQQPVGEYVTRKQETDERFVIVIGESLNRHHMGLYGYGRDTTPLLVEKYRDQGLLRFNKAYASHTHTMAVMRLALSEANQLNGMPYYAAASLPDIANAAGMETLWFSNQIVDGEADEFMSVVARQSGKLHTYNRQGNDLYVKEAFDDVLLKDVAVAISDGPSDKSRVIFVHLMGSHVRYCERYPASFDHFNTVFPAVESGEITFDEALINSINCYDNSVYFNDSVVADILDVLMGQGGVSGFIYFSDHGEDVIGQHGHKASQFTNAMADIPLLMWFSEDYKKRYPEKVAALEKHVDSLFPNGLMYDTIIGVLGLETGHYEVRHDLSNKQYNVKHFPILNGTRDYAAPVDGSG